MPQSKDPSDLAEAIEALEGLQAQMREKLAQLDRDRGWLLVLGLVFAGKAHD